MWLWKHKTKGFGQALLPLLIILIDINRNRNFCYFPPFFFSPLLHHKCRWSSPRLISSGCWMTTRATQHLTEAHSISLSLSSFLVLCSPIWECSDINNQTFSSCWPSRLARSAHLSMCSHCEGYWSWQVWEQQQGVEKRRMKGGCGGRGWGCAHNQKRSVTLPWNKEWQKFVIFSPSHFICFFFLSSFPHPIQFYWDLRASLTKDDSSSADKAGAERSWIAIIWYSW